MENKIIYALVGKTLSGKSTLIKNVVDKINADFVISFTSRPQRHNEVNGVDYYFFTKEEAEEIILSGKVIALRAYTPHSSLNDDCWYYGLPLIDLLSGENKKLVITDPLGIQAIKKYFKNVRVIYLDISKEEQEKRLKSRGEKLNDEQIRRMLDDDIEFKHRLKTWDYRLDATKSLDDLQKELVSIVNK